MNNFRTEYTPLETFCDFAFIVIFFGNICHQIPYLKTHDKRLPIAVRRSIQALLFIRNPGLYVYRELALANSSILSLQSIQEVR